MKRLLVGALALSLSWTALGYAQTAGPQQSRSGPEAPPEAGSKDVWLGSREAALTHTIAGVPGYLWRHGCGPTAVGMVIGYYDTHGFSDLVAGDSSTQTNDVQQAIASQGSGVRGSGTQRHYEDYSLPMDSGQPSVLTDSSATYPAGCHVDDCIADFMHTSWSKDGNFYGWSWSNRIGPSFTSYVNLRKNGYQPSCTQYLWDALTWSVLTNEVDNNRPMVFLVDSSGDGSTDHFVTVVAYTDSPNQQYGCLDTWAPASQIRWCQFRAMSSSYAWGVWGGWSFSLHMIKPVNPNPADMATGVSVTETLSWSNGGGATSFDVYLGTSPSPGSGEFKGNQTGTTFSPGRLSHDTTHYWRIDAKNDFGTTTGDVWRFTTERVQVPADFNDDGHVDGADLSLFRPCMTGCWAGSAIERMRPDGPRPRRGRGSVRFRPVPEVHQWIEHAGGPGLRRPFGLSRGRDRVGAADGARSASEGLISGLRRSLASSFAMLLRDKCVSGWFLALLAKAASPQAKAAS